MGKILSVTFRNDELKKIEAYMIEFSMKRHEVIKLAIRSFLFPDEEEHPLNGAKGMINDSFLLGTSPEAIKSRERINKLYHRGLHNVDLSPPPVTIFKSEADLKVEQEEMEQQQELEEKKAKARKEADKWLDTMIGPGLPKRRDDGK